VAQFAVYRNRSPRSKVAFPLLVDVQSDLLEPLHTRVVVPLTKVVPLSHNPLSHLAEQITFEGERYVLMTPQLAGMARADLGAQAGSLESEQRAILAAVDFLISGF